MLTNSPCWFDLSDLVLLQVEGLNPSAFLQGQLSCDVREVTADTMRPGALCSLKGRITALMDVIQWQGLGLLVSKALQPLIEKDLAAVARLSRVTLTVNEGIFIVGLQCSHPENSPYPLPKEQYQTTYTDTYCCYALDPDLYIFISKTKLTIPSLQDSLAWHRLLLERNHPTIYPETSGQFLPQPLGLDNSKYFSFTKGCYKGQEIIARMHYRGVNKYSLQQATVRSATPLVPGGVISSTQSKQVIGEWVDVAFMGDNTYLALASVLNTHLAEFTTR